MLLWSNLKQQDEFFFLWFMVFRCWHRDSWCYCGLLCPTDTRDTSCYCSLVQITAASILSPQPIPLCPSLDSRVNFCHSILGTTACLVLFVSSVIGLTKFGYHFEIALSVTPMFIPTASICEWNDREMTRTIKLYWQQGQFMSLCLK